MKKQLEAEIKKYHKKEQTQTVRPDAIAIKFNLKRSPKYKNLSEDAIQKIVKKRLLLRQKAREKNYVQQSINNIVIDNPINELFEYHLNSNDKNKVKTLIVLHKYLELEDENKKLTLTDTQYETWLKASEQKQFITTKQFEVLYGLSSRQQKSLRQKLHDPLPYIKLNENANILYNRAEVEKWFENYEGKIKV